MRKIMTTALLLSAAIPSMAWAQSTGTTNDGGVEDIVVRAQRVAQSLQAVPVAVTPVSAKELETKRLHDLVQLTLAVPSLEVTTDNAFTLRGVGSQIFSSNVDSSVGVMVDDISLGVPIFMSNAAFVDIDQVEALTGPQGLLFGRNASAGLLNVITKKPIIGETHGDVSVEYDNRDTPGGHFGIVATGILNIPVSSNSALRLNILESSQDPITKAVTDISPNNQAKQLRFMAKGKFLWEPTSDMSVYLIGDYSRERGVGGIWDDSWRVTGLNAAGVPNSGGSAGPNAAADGVTPGTENLERGVSGEDFRSVDTGGVTLTVSDKLSSNLTLTNIMGWRHFTLSYNLDSDVSASTGLDINAGHQTYNQYSDELRLAYRGGRLDGQVGLYAFSSVNDGTALFDGTGGTPFPHLLYGTADFHLTGRTLAAYGQFNFHATDALTLIGGARVSNDRVSVRSVADDYGCLGQPFGPAGPCLPFVNIFGPQGQKFNQTNSYTNFSYKVGAQYDIMAGTMVYATWSTGYKGPAQKANLASLTESPYLRPETVTDLEVGFKAKLFDNKLRLNVAGFIEKFKNFQVQAFNSDSISTLTNAEGVKSSGVEINSTFKPIPALTFNYNATIADSHFTKFSGNPCYTLQPASTCPNGQFFEGAGIKTPTAAKYHGTVEAIYEFVLAGDAKIDLEGNWYHRSSLNFSSAGAPYTALGPIDVFGASISYRTERGFNLSVFCKNCTNKIYPNFIGTLPIDAALAGVASTFNRWGYNSVRTIGGSIGYKF